MRKNILFTGFLVACFIVSLSSCSKTGAGPGGTGTTVIPPVVFDINSIHDTYGDVAPYAYYYKWGSYNVHDSSVKKFGDYYYSYSTGAGYGIPGMQVRKYTGDSKAA